MKDHREFRGSTISDNDRWREDDYKRLVFDGNDTYSVDATGDCCVGDRVKFSQTAFKGSYRNAKFSHFNLVEGEIIKDSYGLEKQQHTFTIKLLDGSTMRIKGRNLYKNGVFRMPWGGGAKRHDALEDKHERGRQAREMRQERRQEDQEEFIYDR